MALALVMAVSGCDKGGPSKGGEAEGESTPNEVTPAPFTFSKDPNYYTELYRPQYHLSPETGNMSDPNGMVFSRGVSPVLSEQRTVGACGQHGSHSLAASAGGAATRFAWRDLVGQRGGGLERY